MSAYTIGRRNALAAFAVCLAGCSESNAPQDPVWGKEPCAFCRMLVSDKRFAAQTLTGNVRRYFDDVGCLVAWLARERKAGAAWVREDGVRWIDAHAARYATGAQTPMDSGFEARSSGTTDFAAVQAAVLNPQKKVER